MADSNADVFLQLKDAQGELIEGDCVDKKFAGWIEIDDFEVSDRSMSAMQAENEAEKEAQEGGEESSGGKVRAGSSLEWNKGRQRVGGSGTATGDRQGAGKTGGKKAGKKGSKGSSDNQGVFTLKINKDTDSSSPMLAFSYSRNLRSAKDCFKSGKLVVRKRGGGGVQFLTFLFKNLYVVNYSLNLSGGKAATASSLPDEDIEFVFESMALKYIKQAKGGEGTSDPYIASWNFKKHDTDADLETEIKS
jgi:type VI protein secretion system component Hcp